MFLFLGLIIATIFSATAGFGGSLISLPVLLFFFDPKEAVALSAFILAINNIGKVGIYWSDIRWKQITPLIIVNLLTIIPGIALLLVFPDNVVLGLILLIILFSLICEFTKFNLVTKWFSWITMAIAGFNSGLSGTSGPTKALAVRLLNLSKDEQVAGLSAISMTGDILKSIVFFSSGYYLTHSWVFMVAPLVAVIGCFCGYNINKNLLNEKGFTILFWGTIVAYSIKLLPQL